MSLTVQFSEYGTTDVLHVVDVAAPTAGPRQVRLVVRAAGVNPADWKIMQGLMRQQIPLTFPAGLGTDVAGVVDEVGAGVTAFGVGDEVLGFSLTPAYAQFSLADPASLVAKPAKVPWEVAGSLAGAGGTAWAVLEELDVTKGETLLIHAAAGGVGTFAVQLAVARGARVIGTASTGRPRPRRWCRPHGPRRVGWRLRRLHHVSRTVRDVRVPRRRHLHRARHRDHPQRQTALVAKQAAEVDLLTQGRFRLGVGLGWNPVEYEALSQPFDQRGRRLSEQIELLRRLWTETSITHTGTFDTITGAGIAPLPIQRPIPIWIGGLSGAGSAEE